MKYKAAAGDWTMTYDDEAKLLTMRRAERGKGFSDSHTIKGDFDFSEFKHVPTAAPNIELALYWLDEFKPCENYRGELYNPFAEKINQKGATTIGNALMKIYTDMASDIIAL